MTSITAISASNFSTRDNGSYQNMEGVASSANGQIIYVAVNGGAVWKSTNNGSTWNNIYSGPPPPNNVSFRSIACSSDGSIVYGAFLGVGLYKSIDAGLNWNKVTFLSPTFPYSADNTLPGGAANPETGAPFGGYTLDNIFKIACDSTGTKLIMTTNASVSIYQSIDGGPTWSFVYTAPGYKPTAGQTPYVTSNADGSILYASLNTIASPYIVASTNSGATWAPINMFSVVGPFSALSTNSYGDFLYAVDSTSKLNTFYTTHADVAVIAAPSGDTYIALANYNNGNNLIISQNTYPPGSITGGAVVLYSVVNKYPAGPEPIVCFKEDTKILTDQGYKLIQDLRKGDLIKTLMHGFVPINMIGKRDIEHLASNNRIKDQLYKCSQDKYPEIMDKHDDLIITGCHSILVDDFKDGRERERTIEINGDTFVTDRKYRLPACADERAAVYEIPGTYTIYHIALDHDDYYMNYGIYANGLLVETCSKRNLIELSNMTLID